MGRLIAVEYEVRSGVDRTVSYSNLADLRKRVVALDVRRGYTVCAMACMVSR